MCTLCLQFEPWTDECLFATDEPAVLAPRDDGSGGVLADPPVYTYDQIAEQLVEGYWGGTARSFDVSVGDTLYVDISALTAAGQNMARMALEAWSAVTGLIFVEVAGTAPPVNTITETADAASSASTIYTMAVGDDFLGNLSTGADRDMIRISLLAGQSIQITLSGEGPSATADPYLSVMDASGNVLAVNDDASGRNSALTFQASATGTYYIQASSFGDANPGTYRLAVRQAGLTADIVFDDSDSGAYSTFTTFGDTIQSSYVNISPTWGGGSERIDGYYYQTYLHEIGHALGLGHAGFYNGSATYGIDNHYQNDSWQASVMSYFHQTENTSIDASFAYVITPQIADIIAIHALYGTPEANTGDTVYGPNGTSGTHLDDALSLSNPVSFTVYDTGGTDTFDFSPYSSHQTMDLRAEAHSDLAGLDGNIAIARGTVIEIGLTGTGNDAIVGNAADNGLSAGFGADTVSGGAGNDAIVGGSGNDSLMGDDGFDMIEGGSGDNVIQGGDGGDLLIADGVTLAMLTMVYPSWTPPSDAQSLIDQGELWTLWEDILGDTGLIV